MPASRLARDTCSCAPRSLTRCSATRASVFDGLARASFVYSTTARSKSCASSACRPRRMPEAVAHAAVIARTTARVRARRAARDDIGTSRNPEDEYAVGQPGILAVVGELERRASPLLIRRGERSNLQRRPVDAEHQPVVIALLLSGVEPQGPRPLRRAVRVAHVEVAGEVALVGEQ